MVKLTTVVVVEVVVVVCVWGGGGNTGVNETTGRKGREAGP
jgi:hypothetical protein